MRGKAGRRYATDSESGRCTVAWGGRGDVGRVRVNTNRLPETTCYCQYLDLDVPVSEQVGCRVWHSGRYAAILIYCLAVTHRI